MSVSGPRLSVDEDAGVVFASTGNNYTGEASDTSDAFLALPLADGANFRWKQQIFEGDVFTIRQSNGNPDADFGANPILFEVEGRKLVAGGNKGGDFWVLDRTDGTIIKQRNLGPNAWSRFQGRNLHQRRLGRQQPARRRQRRDEHRPKVARKLRPGSVATLFAFDPLTLEIKWERQVVGPAFSPISVANGVGFFGKNTTLQAFDTATGDCTVRVSHRGTIASAPAISDGYVVFGSGMPWIQRHSRHQVLRAQAALIG